MTPPPSNAASCATPSAASDNGTEVTLSATTSLGRGAEKRLGSRAALMRLSHEDRWEEEVSRSVGSSAGRSQVLNTRGSRDFTSSEGLNPVTSRNTARLTMKSTGGRLAEFSRTGGSCVTEEETVEAANRAQKRSMEKKKEALAAEAVKASERAAKMAASRKKAKQTQLRHELRIHEAAAKKSAAESQAQHDKDVLHDIVCRRREAQQRIAQKAVQDDSLECILQWALPEAKTADEALRILSGHVGDDNTVLKLMAKDLSKDDGEAVNKLMASHDDKTVLDLVRGDLGKEGDDDTVLKLMAGGSNTFQANDNATVLKLLTKAGGTASGDDEVLRLLAKGTGNNQDNDTMLSLMGKTTDAKSTTMQRLMAKTSLATASLEDTSALLMLMRKEFNVDNPTLRGLIRSDLKDDEAFRRILDAPSGREEARANADALRFILGGAADPVTRLAQLARNRPRAGRSKANADAAQAVRDLQLLNQMLETSEADVDVQAWKDVGAIHMMMQDLPGPDPAKRPKGSTLQKDNDAMQALMGGPPLQPVVQAGTDDQVVKRLLGHSTSGALERLTGQPAAQLDHRATDTKIIQQIMSPRSLAAAPTSQPSMEADTNLVHQLMGTPCSSPVAAQPPQGLLGGYGGSMAPNLPVGLGAVTQAPNLLGSYAGRMAPSQPVGLGAATQAPNLLGSYAGGMAPSQPLGLGAVTQAPNLLGSYAGCTAPAQPGGLLGGIQAPTLLGGYNGNMASTSAGVERQSASLQQQDTQVARSLMGGNIGISQAQTMNDVNTLQTLFR